MPSGVEKATKPFYLEISFIIKIECCVISSLSQIWQVVELFGILSCFIINNPF